MQNKFNTSIDLNELNSHNFWCIRGQVDINCERRSQGAYIRAGIAKHGRGLGIFQYSQSQKSGHFAPISSEIKFFEKCMSLNWSLL